MENNLHDNYVTLSAAADLSTQMLDYLNYNGESAMMRIRAAGKNSTIHDVQRAILVLFDIAVTYMEHIAANKPYPELIARKEREGVDYISCGGMVYDALLRAGVHPDSMQNSDVRMLRRVRNCLNDLVEGRAVQDAAAYDTLKLTLAQMERKPYSSLSATP